LPDQLFFDIVKMVVALACIVGLIYGVVFVLKRLVPGAAGSGGERIGLTLLGQLSLGSRQRICVLRVQDRTLVVGISEGSITTLAELDAPRPVAEKEADDPKIFADLLAWRKDSAAPVRPGPATAGPSAPAGAEHRAPELDDGPRLFAPGERPAR